MMDGAAQTASPASSSLRQRIPYACEACRVSKAKCEPSNTEGICRRCFTSKRECIFKTGPRKRRRRSKLHPAATRLTPPPCAPSKTFTIDVPVQAGDDPDEDPLESLGNLKELHERVIELLVSDNDLQEDGAAGMLAPEASSATASGSASSSAFTPPTTSRPGHSFSSIRPQFNLDSATSLLRSFSDDMLPRFPVITLPPDASVPSLAKDRPFVLLAILAAASSVRSLQGHSLYDEEFRKILGLKFVSGGERSVELLTGLLIYCAWYPYHLRPKNRQAQQYIQMAGGIVRDLNLDEPPADVDITRLRASNDRLACMRAYLACYYISSVFAPMLRGRHAVPYQQWTMTCCSVLDRESDDREAEADRTLVWLVRLGNIVEETMAIDFRQKDTQKGPQYLQLMLKGLEAQLREWQGRMPAGAATKPVLRMANWCAEILLHGQPLLKFPNVSSKTRSGAESHVEAERLLRCVNVLRLWFDYITSLPASELISFIAVEWGYLIIMIILGLKLSFPLPHDCPSWDHAAARKILDLGSFFQKFANIGDDEMQPSAPANQDRKRPNTDVLSASKAVIGVVQDRYERRVVALDKAAADAMMMQTASFGEEEDHRMRRCPMFDGSMDPYLEAWDDSFVNTLDFANPSPTLMVPAANSDYYAGGVVVDREENSNPAIQQAGFHDLWATMTMGWGDGGG